MTKLKRYFITVNLSGYFIFLLFLLQTGSLRKYVNPRLSFLTVLTLVILGAMLFHNFASIVVRPKKHSHDKGCAGHHHEDDCDCGHHHDDGDCGHHHAETVPMSSYILFLPLLLSMMVAPETLTYQANPNPNAWSYQPRSVTNNNSGNSSNAVNIGDYLPQPGTVIQSQRPSGQGEPNAETVAGANEYQIAAGTDATKTKTTMDTGQLPEYTQLQIGDIIFDTPKAPKQKLLNSKIRLIGKVMKSPLLQEDEIVVYRMIISCCAADGLPAGVLVKLPKSGAYRENDWVGVEGSIQLLRFDPKLKNIDPLAIMATPEKLFPYMTATAAAKVTPPQDEYLYP